MEHLSSDMEQQVPLEKKSGTRALQQRLQSKRDTQVLQIGLAIVNRDISYLRN